MPVVPFAGRLANRGFSRWASPQIPGEYRRFFSAPCLQSRKSETLAPRQFSGSHPVGPRVAELVPDRAAGRITLGAHDFQHNDLSMAGWPSEARAVCRGGVRWWCTVVSASAHCMCALDMLGFDPPGIRRISCKRKIS